MLKNDNERLWSPVWSIIIKVDLKTVKSKNCCIDLEQKVNFLKSKHEKSA